MNRPDIEAIKQRCERATAGPWYAHFKANSHSVLHDGKMITGGFSLSENNSIFIAHARTDVPELVAYIEELERKIEQYKLQHEINRQLG